MKQDLFKHPVTIFIFATIACILWGSAFPTLKISYDMLGISQSGYLVKLQFAGYRFLLAGLLVLLVVLLLKRDLKIPKEAVTGLILLGLCQTSLQYLFFYNGLANTTGIKGSIITALGTFFSIILPHFYYHDDKMNRKKWIGLIIGFGGVVLVNLSKGPLDAGFSIMGEGLLMMAALTGAVSSIIAKELSKKMDTLVMTSYQMVLGALVMIIFSTAMLGGNTINFTVEFMPYFLHLGLISSLGFGLWFLLLSHNQVSKVSIYKFQIPLWGTMLSAWLLPSESLTPVIWISLIMVSIGILVINAPERKVG